MIAYLTAFTSFSLYSLSGIAVADHGRTEAECGRISDPVDRAECIEHARQTGGAQFSCFSSNVTDIASCDQSIRDQNGNMISPYGCYIEVRNSAGQLTRYDEIDCNQARAMLPGQEERYDIEATCNPGRGQQLNSENCAIYAYLLIFINGLSAMVGIAVVGMIIYGGIQYSMSADDPQKVSAAKDKIKNAIIALVAYISLYAFLQWLIPGGVFRG